MRDKAMAKKARLASSTTNDANGNNKNRPGTAKAKVVEEERIVIDIMDDLAKDDENGKANLPPKEYISAVQKIMNKANFLWEDRLDSLFRVSRSSDMSHDDFIDCLMDLRVDLKAENA